MFSELQRRTQSRNIIFAVIILLSIIFGSCKTAPPVEKIDKHNAEYVYERAFRLSTEEFLRDSNQKIHLFGLPHVLVVGKV